MCSEKINGIVNKVVDTEKLGFMHLLDSFISNLSLVVKKFKLSISMEDWIFEKLLPFSSLGEVVTKKHIGKSLCSLRMESGQSLYFLLVSSGHLIKMYLVFKV